MALTNNLTDIRKDVAYLNFKGLNKKDVISDEEILDGENLASEYAPMILPRLPREDLGYSLADPKDLFAAGGKLCWVDGTSFYYDGVSKGTVTAGKKSMVEFNGYVVIMPDKKYYCFDSENAEHDTFGTFTMADDLDYITVHYNRVVGCKDNMIRASKWGDFKTWDDFSGENDDSWALDVATPGTFTGIATFLDHVVFFKNDFMTELYGSFPAQFQTVDVGKFGLVDQRGHAEGNGYFLFADKDGIKQYTGGIPTRLSDKLNERYVNVAIASDGRRFYVANDNGVDKKLYVFDLQTGAWMPEDDLDVVAFADIEREVYALDSSGKIWKFNSGTEEVAWYFTTKEFDYDSFQRKTLKNIKLKARMEKGSSIKVELKRDDEDFKTVKEYLNQDDDKEEEIYINLKTMRSRRFQLKVSGVGKSLVTGTVEFSYGSDKR